MGTTYSAAVGNPPAPQTLAFGTWTRNELRSCDADVPAIAATYYVSPAGNDSNDGLTTATPIKTLAKVNALIAAGGGKRFLFLRGSTWLDATTINASNDAWFGVYGNSWLPRPILSRFTNVYLSYGWTLVSGDVYSRPETGSVAHFREGGDTRNPYVRCSSVAELQARTATGGWWLDTANGLIKIVRRGGGNPENDFRGYEVAYDNSQQGIYATGTANVVVEDIELHGHGANRANGHTAAWAINKNSTGTMVVRRCGGYFTADHAFGSNAAGRFVVHDCDFGWLSHGLSGQAVAVVGFAATGGQEFVAYSNRAVGGEAPITGVNETGAGQLIYGHTGSGTASLLLAVNNIVEPGPYQCASVTSFANTVTWTDPVNCRSFVINDKFFVRQPTGKETSDLSVTGSGAVDGYTLYINCYFESRLLRATAGDNYHNCHLNTAGWNNHLKLDFSGMSGQATSANAGWANYGGLAPLASNWTIELIGLPRVRVGLNTSALFGTATTAGYIRNSVILFDRPSDNSAAFVNNSTAQSNNVWINLRDPASAPYGGGASGGCDADPYVAYSDFRSVGSPPVSPADPRMSANQQLVLGRALEYAGGGEGLIGFIPRQNESTARGHLELDNGPATHGDEMEQFPTGESLSSAYAATSTLADALVIKPSKTPTALAVTIVTPAENTSDVEVVLMVYETPQATPKEAAKFSGPNGSEWASGVIVSPGTSRTVQLYLGERPPVIYKFVVRIRLTKAAGAATVQLQAGV